MGVRRFDNSSLTVLSTAGHRSGSLNQPTPFHSLVPTVNGRFRLLRQLPTWPLEPYLPHIASR